MAWSVGVAADLCFAAGFAALALVLGLFPNGRGGSRGERVLVRAIVSVAAAAVLLPALSSARLDLVVHARRATGDGPGAVPVTRGRSPHRGGPGAGGARGRRSGRARRTSATRGRRRSSCVHLVHGCSLMVALLLAATPVAVPLPGGTTWAVVFAVAVGAVPFALLAGLTRYRLLVVDLYVTRTLARGALAVLVLCGYALAAAVAGDRSSLALPVAVAVAAALTGECLRGWLEIAVDRFVTGGCLRGSRAVRELGEALDLADPALVAQRAVTAVTEGLQVGWVRLVREGTVVASADDAGDEPPAVVVPLRSDNPSSGAFECGPRHGDWRPEDLETVRAFARQVALVLDNARLTAVLGERVIELEASRRRLVEAEARARRRLERDLHDGVQQQLVALLARLEVLRALLPEGHREAEVAAVAHELARRSLRDLRELVRGISPPLLADRGLVAAVQSQVALLSVPVSVDVDPRLDTARYPADVEGAAYFVVLEALTNVLKHAGTARARVAVTPADDGVTVAVSDEGRGFAEIRDGTGLAGMRDRVEALGGSLAVTSSPGVGTVVVARLPGQAGSRA